MPRISERLQALKGIEEAVESAVVTLVISPLIQSNHAIEDRISMLFALHDSISLHRYLASRGISAGRHAGNSLEAYIHEYSDTGFQALFRMPRESFWQLVQLLTNASSEAYWNQNSTAGRPARPIYQQIAVGLHTLGGAGGTSENSHFTLNIGYGSIRRYAWFTINLLTSLMGEYVRWPAQHARRSDNHRFFRRCIGFLDGLNIVLRDKPMDDPEAYFSRKKSYGFNIQAICDWDRKFIWAFMGHTASVHDSTAFKSSDLYRNTGSTLIRRNTS